MNQSYWSDLCSSFILWFEPVCVLDHLLILYDLPDFYSSGQKQTEHQVQVANK